MKLFLFFIYFNFSKINLKYCEKKKYNRNLKKKKSQLQKKYNTQSKQY